MNMLQMHNTQNLPWNDKKIKNKITIVLKICPIFVAKNKISTS